MLKKMVLLMGLLITLGVLLGYQWISFQHIEASDDGSQDKLFQVRVSIEHKEKNYLSVKQRVTGLQLPSYVLQVPSVVKELSCSVDEGECGISKIGDQWKVVNPNQTALTLIYTIPFQEMDNNWFDDWFVLFLNSDGKPIVGNYLVTVSEKVSKENTWFLGGNLQSKNEEETLVYFAWRKEKTITLPLFFTKASLTYEHVENRIDMYVESSDRMPEWTKTVKLLPEESGVTAVFLKDVEKQIGPRLLVNDIDDLQQEENLVHAHLLDILPPAESSEVWLWETVASLFTPTNSLQGKKQKVMNELLTNYPYTSKEMERFRALLLNNEMKQDEVNVGYLDEQLSVATGKKTEFFQLNKDESQPLIPLYYLDQRQVFIDEKKASWSVLELSGTIYLPLEDVMSYLGFDAINLSEKEIRIRNTMEDAWLLFVNETYYLYNANQYELAQYPVKVINNNQYLSEEFVETVLKVDVIKRDDGVFLENIGF